MARKTKRRRQGKLGAPNEVHEQRAVQFANEARGWALDAEDYAGKGKCAKAIKSFGLATERLGQARAHLHSTTKQGTSAMLRLEAAAAVTLGLAEDTFIAKCLLPSRLGDFGAFKATKKWSGGEKSVVFTGREAAIAFALREDADKVVDETTGEVVWRRGDHTDISPAPPRLFGD